MSTKFKCGEDKYAIKYNGEIVSYINPAMCKKQGLSDDTIKLICEAHSVKYGILENMKNTLVGDTDTLKHYAAQITEIEYTLQRLWGFPENSDYHRFWNVPHCKCCSLDNEERLGTPYRIINKECPVHGQPSHGDNVL